MLWIIRGSKKVLCRSLTIMQESEEIREASVGVICRKYCRQEKQQCKGPVVGEVGESLAYLRDIREARDARAEGEKRRGEG